MDVPEHRALKIIDFNQATVPELVKSKETEMGRGTAEEADHLIGLFDKYRPEKAVLVAPHLHD
jgi:hypothetical protein